ncbi:endonuclease/exonuclease/phosphatase family protein [Ancylothrix sp. C2]|uniref:endonuclease/exonuclease/phosphatase family protein n=1 Tax=Ancylothrix sp. D3o TaxID=2953691 RepID=UPI0021BB9522|nr:endonuclease/exonuclease/phosphatase family protein [Ancylothrix sp. D3o]MCT7951486.1 endonuclease/exonuclease/phosphatase family protein [Ancylothrix sp. D3o]
MKVISFNLRFDKPDPGNNAWKYRLKAITELIHSYAPDIIGTQELLPHQMYDLLGKLPDYQCVGNDRTCTGKGEYCAIFYRTELLCLATGDFCLSDTPEIPGSISESWGNPIPRMATWAIFSDPNQQKFTLFNTHLDYRSQKARELGAKLICERMSQIQNNDSFLLLTGDFNAEPQTIARQTFLKLLSNNIQLVDALGGLPISQQQTFHDFTGKAFAAIDTIYYDSRLKLQQVKIDTGRWLEVWPSDHLPVIAEVS